MKTELIILLLSGGALVYSQDDELKQPLEKDKTNDEEQKPVKAKSKKDSAGE